MNAGGRLASLMLCGPSGAGKAMEARLLADEIEHVAARLCALVTVDATFSSGAEPRGYELVTPMPVSYLETEDTQCSPACRSRSCC